MKIGLWKQHKVKVLWEAEWILPRTRVASEIPALIVIATCHLPCVASMELCSHPAPLHCNLRVTTQAWSGKGRPHKIETSYAELTSAQHDSPAMTIGMIDFSCASLCTGMAPLLSYCRRYTKDHQGPPRTAERGFFDNKLTMLSMIDQLIACPNP
jgi:hypothetical protein